MNGKSWIQTHIQKDSIDQAVHLKSEAQLKEFGDGENRFVKFLGAVQESMKQKKIQGTQT